MSSDMPMHDPERVLPSFSLSEDDLPEVQSWDVNGRYFLVVQVEMTGKENTDFVMSEDEKDNKKLIGRFRVKAVKAMGENPIKKSTLEQELMEEEFSEKMSEAR